MNWQEIFAIICSVPHTSGNEGALREKLSLIAAENGLVVRVDKRGNMAVDRPASAGFENVPAIIMQGHLDMVAQAAEGVDFDFSSDSISFRQDGDWISTGGRTSLGADNALGVALAMEILLDRNFRCGPLRGVFTVEEETGLCGAAEIDPELLEGKYLLNLDSEDDGAFIAGCAGSTRTTGVMKPEHIHASGGSRGVKITLYGFPGGHSGTDIHKPLGNAVKRMAELLQKELRQVAVSSIDGGTVFNALPRSCSVTGCVPENFTLPEPELPNGVFLRMEDVPLPPAVLPEDCRRALIEALEQIPHGVVTWSRRFAGLPETSSNLAAVKTVNGDLVIDTSQRSFIFAEQQNVVKRVKEIMENNGFASKEEGSYGPWEPAENNRLAATAMEVWREVVGAPCSLTVIHAGLEVADLLRKNPGLEAISAGPLIENPHSPAERFSLASTLRIRKWLHRLLEVLSAAPETER